MKLFDLFKRRSIPDARTPVLATELLNAGRALAVAAESMKHQRITPHQTSQTRAAATRALQTLGQLGFDNE